MEHRAAAVASRAIQLALTDGSFKVADVRRGLDDPPSGATITRVLRQLEADDWLERRSSKSSIWRAGTQARMLGDMSEGALDAAERDPVTTPDESEAGAEWDLDW